MTEREIMKKIPPDGWRAMNTAPRDGTLIIVLLSDASGVDLLRWVAPNEEFDDGGWCPRDEECKFYEDDDFVGWIPFPYVEMLKWISERLS